MPKNTKFANELVALLPRLRRFSMSLTGSVQESEDLVQAAVERALRRGGPPEADLCAWMLKVLKNLWIDEIRRRRFRVVEPLSEEAMGEDGRKTTADRLDWLQAHRAMESLPIEQRLVLALIVIEGLSYQQAADVLGAPIGTVMSRLARARAALADRLADAPGEGKRAPAHETR